MRRLLIHTENRFALSRTAYADSVDIALHEIPDGVYCTSPPEIVEQYYIEGSKEAKKYESKITISKDGKSAEATKLMALMGLGVKCGENVEVSVEGADEDAAFEGIKAFFEANL